MTLHEVKPLKYIALPLNTSGLIRTAVTISGNYISFVENKCGGYENGESGLIKSPDKNHDGLYDLDIECIWQIQIQVGKEIEYEVFYVRLAERCETTFITVSQAHSHFLYRTT